MLAPGAEPCGELGAPCQPQLPATLSPQLGWGAGAAGTPSKGCSRDLCRYPIFLVSCSATSSSAFTQQRLLSGMTSFLPHIILTHGASLTQRLCGRYRGSWGLGLLAKESEGTCEIA
jgi:hypothetical protein